MTTSATFFFITDTRSTDKSCEAQPAGETSSSHDGKWRWVSSRKAA